MKVDCFSRSVPLKFLNIENFLHSEQRHAPTDAAKGVSFDESFSAFPLNGGIDASFLLFSLQ